MELSRNAQVVLERRYLKKDSNGKIIETPEEMFRRVAKNIAEVDLQYDKNADVHKKEEEFYSIIANLEFIPNSPTLMNAGRELQQLSACFVLPIEDSMDSIFETIKNTALIHKSGGGTGFSFSRIRPKNDKVLSTKGISSGPVSFMTVFDAATETVKQGGTRRGANMGILNVDHPDILEFITCKYKDYKINNFNISVAVTEDFMEKVIRDEEYDLINPRTGEVAGQLSAKKVFNLIVNLAWKNGEPGIIFLDRINRDNPTPHIGRIESTNPCGEQPLIPYESCNLGSINLSKMVTYPKGKAEIDFARLRRVVHIAVQFLDNVIDANKYPLPEIEEMTKSNRKIGLGVMGFADLLIKLNVPYNSKKAIEIGEKVMKFINDESKKASVEIAEKRGTFPNYKGSIYDIPGGLRLRNATTTTIAPTGTISIIAGCSSGIEPLYAISYIRNVLDNDQLLEIHPIFAEIAKKEGFFSIELMKNIAEKGSIQKFSEIPDNVKRIFLTAHDITPEWHVRMQAAFQQYVDNAVSKTINFPNTAKAKDVEEAFMLAYKLGCKGITVYRDGSRKHQVLSTQKKRKPISSKEIIPRERQKITRGITEKIKTSDGTLYLTINWDDEGLCEVFTNIGKHGSDVAAWSEAVGRLISLCLRSGVSPKHLVNQLIGITSHPIWQNGIQILSVPDAIGKALARYIKNDDDLSFTIEEGPDFSTEGKVNYLTCPDCGGMIEHESGCIVCKLCGYSKCG
ncbi:ribonucleotide-diphosphate reductase subunit alpha [candidate division KSB1 bacterium]|nr:MAG: ribonucleotide-diphosphate reductase subunit alpha [candidate division KSB1 bacterium]